MLYLQDMDSPGCPGLILLLQRGGNGIHTFPVHFSDAIGLLLDQMQEMIACHHIRMIVLPHHSDCRPAAAGLHASLQRIMANLSGVDSTYITIEYPTPYTGASRINLVCPLTEQNQKTRAAAASQHKSQMERLRLDLVAENNTSAAAIAFQIRQQGRDLKINSLECFHFTEMVRGEEQPLAGCYGFGSIVPAGWNPVAFEHGDILFFAPHYDDADLGAPGLLSEALALGCGVHVVYMTTGYRAIMKDHTGKWIAPDDIAAKTAMREAESQSSAKVLGLREPIHCLRFGFYDREIVLSHPESCRETEEGYPVYAFSQWTVLHPESPEYHAKGRYEITPSADAALNDKEVYHIQSRLGGRWVTAEEITAAWTCARNILEKTVTKDQRGPLVIVLPDMADQHPDHLATRFIGREVAKKISAEYPNPILLVYCQTAWAGDYNGYVLNTPAEYSRLERIVSEFPADPLAWYQSLTRANALIALELTSKGGMGTTPYLGVQNMERHLCTVHEKENPVSSPIADGPFIMICQQD